MSSSAPWVWDKVAGRRFRWDELAGDYVYEDGTIVPRERFKEPSNFSSTQPLRTPTEQRTISVSGATSLPAGFAGMSMNSQPPAQSATPRPNNVSSLTQTLPTRPSAASQPYLAGSALPSEPSGWVLDQGRQTLYYYEPRSDSLMFRDGQRMKRPQNIDPSRFYTAAASYQQGRNREAQPQVPDQRQVARQRDPYPHTMSRDPSYQPPVLPPAQLVTGVAATGPTSLGALSGQNFDLERSQRYRMASTRSSISSETSESLDSTFKVQKHASRFFKVGKVFMMLHVGPAGGSSTGVSPERSSSSMTRDSRFGEMIFSKIRRFVVVRQGRSHSTALPITTYGKQGVGKRGVAKSDHAIVYTGKQPPDLMASEAPQRGENGMRFRPIRVDPDRREELLDPASRIDFASPHTIYHNVKVRSFGFVNAASLQDLLRQFANVFRVSQTNLGKEDDVDSQDEDESNNDEDESSDDEDKIINDAQAQQLRDAHASGSRGRTAPGGDSQIGARDVTSPNQPQARPSGASVDDHVMAELIKRGHSRQEAQHLMQRGSRDLIRSALNRPQQATKGDNRDRSDYESNERHRHRHEDDDSEESDGSED